MLKKLLIAAILVMVSQPAYAERNTIQEFFEGTHKDIGSIFGEKSENRQTLKETSEKTWKWLWE